MKPLTLSQAVEVVSRDFANPSIPDFRVGDTLRVQVKIVEGNKERIQAFQGVVIKRTKGNHVDASFTVRKVSFNIGVERTFPLHSKRITIEPVSRAKVRRAKLFYLRPLRGKATRLKTEFMIKSDTIKTETVDIKVAEEVSAA